MGEKRCRGSSIAGRAAAVNISRAPEARNGEKSLNMLAKASPDDHSIGSIVADMLPWQRVMY